MKPPLMARLRTAPVVGLFFDKSFVHYAWIGGLISLLNIFLLWFLIDVVHLATVVASALVIGGTFLLRYILFRIFNV